MSDWHPCEWRVIPGASRYEVSSDGRVRRGEREKARSLNDRGYEYVSIVWDDRPNVSRSTAVHRLVMLAFVGPRPERLVTRHLNGVKTDNRLENLAYGTHRENNRDTVVHGHHREASKTHCAEGHELAGDNLIVLLTQPQKRRCRECSLARNRAWYARQKRATPEGAAS